MWVVAAVAFLLGAYVIWSDRLGTRYGRRARLIEKTPTTRIAEAKPGECVEITGRAVPAEEGVLAVPGGPSEALYYTVRVEDRALDDKGRPGTNTIVFECRGVPFLVDDGSGRHARIDPCTADVDLRLCAESMGESTVAELAPAVRALVEKTGELTSGPSGKVRVTRRTIVPGDPIYAIGFGELITRPEPTEHYRGGLRTLLLMRTEGDHQVLLGNSEQDVLYLQRMYEAVLNAVPWKGVALIVAGLAIAIWLVLR